MNNHPTSGYSPTRHYHLFPNPSKSGPPSADGEPVVEKKPEPTPSSPAPPAAPPMHLQRGLTLYAQGETLAALWAFSQGTDLEPEDPLGHYLCGLAFQALDHGREARAEWETVLTLTADAQGSGGETPSADTQWVRGLVQRLLARGSVEAEERPTAGELPALDDHPALDDRPQIGTEGMGMRSQGELETAIRDAVWRHGGCHVQDRSLAAILGVTTEEQVVGWMQSFSERAGLSCHPHRQAIRQQDHPQGVHQQEGDCDGVVFERPDLRRYQAPEAWGTASA